MHGAGRVKADVIFQNVTVWINYSIDFYCYRHPTPVWMIILFWFTFDSVFKSLDWYYMSMIL